VKRNGTDPHPRRRLLKCGPPPGQLGCFEAVHCPRHPFRRVLRNGTQCPESGLLGYLASNGDAVDAVGEQPSGPTETTHERCSNSNEKVYLQRRWMKRDQQARLTHDVKTCRESTMYAPCADGSRGFSVFRVRVLVQTVCVPQRLHRYWRRRRATYIVRCDKLYGAKSVEMITVFGMFSCRSS
jgi:hypothetical protein